MNSRALSILKNLWSNSENEILIYFGDNERLSFYCDYKCIVYAWYSKYNCGDIDSQKKLFDFFVNRLITRIETKNVVIYDRQQYFRYFLKLLIEQSEMYARICGYPKRLERLGVFECT